MQSFVITALQRAFDENDRGIPNPTEYKRQKGLRYKLPKSKASTRWKYAAVANMLDNEIYIGHMIQGKYGSVSYIIAEIAADRWSARIGQIFASVSRTAERSRRLCRPLMSSFTAASAIT